MKKNYLFYDLETSGLHKSFDQIMQFAAIKTDSNFNEIDRYDFLVKLNPDTIASPKAILTHKVGISKANKSGISEYEAISQIHRIFNEENTISLGYNTLGFDDEFLRFSFYRNLFNPYTHQYNNNCSRMDIFPIAVCYYLFKNDAIKWPLNEDNEISLKLENINKKNNFAEGEAHNALVDVEATIGLAKALKSYDSKMWDYLEKCFIKNYELNKLKNLKGGLKFEHSIFYQALLIDGKIGRKRNFQATVLFLGRHNYYKNQYIFLDLESEKLSSLNESILNLPFEEKIEYFRVFRKKIAETPILLPSLSRFIKNFDEDRINLIKKNKKFLQENYKLLLKIQEEFLNFTYEDFENVDLDADLYKRDFKSLNNDLLISEEFHKENIFCNKLEIMEKMEGTLKDRVLRILSRLNVSALKIEDQEKYQEYLNKISSFDENDLPIDFKGIKRISLQNILEEINILKENNNLNDEELSLIEDMENYYLFN